MVQDFGWLFTLDSEQWVSKKKEKKTTTYKRIYNRSYEESMAFRKTVPALTVTTALRRCTKGADYNDNQTHNQYQSNKFYVFVIISWARSFILMQRVTVDH